jgi:hypothetical protein
MRTEFCNGRKPNRSMINPTKVAVVATTITVTNSGVRGALRPPSQYRPHEIDRALRKINEPAAAEDQG